MKVLIIKIGAVGDVIMALPMIDVIKKNNHDVHITWLCGKSVEPLLKYIWSIDTIISINDRNLLTGSIFQKSQALFSVWKKLIGNRYDLILTCHTDWRYRLLGIPVRSNEHKFFSKNNGRYRFIPGRHHSDEYVRLATGIDDCNAKEGRLPVLEVLLSDHLKACLEQQKSRSGKLVALAPGGAKNIMRDDDVRRWPIEYYVDLAKKLVAAEYSVVVTGAVSDIWVRQHFDGLPVIDMVGQTSLIELVALYAKCDLVITHDSGPLHMAGLSDCKILGLFGPTVPGEKIPQASNAFFIWGGQQMPCCPCYDGKDYAVCTDNKCLCEVTVDRVYNEVLMLLNL